MKGKSHEGEKDCQIESRVRRHCAEHEQGTRDLQGPKFLCLLTPQRRIFSCITGVRKQLLN